jgi:flagellar hook-length control protein FliK
MVGQQQQVVELHLNPPSLGPLEVRVTMSDGQANLSFMTQHLPVREAIEGATSRLREMLGDSGISMGSVSVNVGTFAQQQSSAQQDDGRSTSTFRQSANETDFFSGVPAVAVRSLHSNGMVDTFA